MEKLFDNLLASVCYTVCQTYVAVVQTIYLGHFYDKTFVKKNADDDIISK